jgi:hypothetical protein
VPPRFSTYIVPSPNKGGRKLIIELEIIEGNKGGKLVTRPIQ